MNIMHVVILKKYFSHDTGSELLCMVYVAQLRAVIFLLFLFCLDGFYTVILM